MNSEEKNPLSPVGGVSNGVEEPLAVCNQPSANGWNGETRPQRSAAAAAARPDAARTSTQPGAEEPVPPKVPAAAPKTPVNAVPQVPVRDREKNASGSGKTWLTVAAVCAAAVLLAAALLGLRSCGKEAVEETAPADGLSQTLPTQSPVMETEPQEEMPDPDQTLSPEEQEYLEVEEWCRMLESEGDYAGTIAFLQSYVGLSREYDDLMEYYAALFMEDTLNTAEALAEDGRYRQAIQLLDNAQLICYCQDFYHTAVRYRQEFGVYNTSLLSAGKLNTFLLHTDGTVDAYGHSMYGELAAGRWTDIIAVSAGDRHVVGLRSDGTVTAAGSNDIQQMDVDSWYDIVAISAGDTHTVGLKADGTVVASGFNEEDQCDMQTLMRNAGGKRIVSVAAGYGHTLALLEDGTVAAVGVNRYGECNVSGWTDIVAVYAGSEISAGLRADGTVVVSGLNAGRWDTDSWTDIVNLTCGDYYLVGLRADGTVVAAGTDDSNYSERGQMDVYGWRDIVMIAAGNDHTVALCADGTVYCIGSDDLDQCECDGVVLDYQ